MVSEVVSGANKIGGVDKRRAQAAGGQGKASIAALDETTFVVVTGRGADNSSVLLYKVVDGKLQFLDALVVDGNFGDVSRPTVRVLRASQHP